MNKIISLLLLAGLLVLPSAPSRAADASALLQKGLFEEEANQNLEAAIKNYQALIQQDQEQRKLVATAVFRLGECYRKQGRTNEAAAQYQRILAEYTEQSTLANLSRQNLAGLGLARARLQPAPSTAVLAIDTEEAEIQRLQTLLKDSPDLINARPDGTYESWLHRAAQEGKLKVAEFLIAKGADVNVRGRSGITPLHSAVSSGNKAMVEFLLAHEANVNARFGQGQTPLHSAAENGYKAIAEILLAHKADVNAATDPSPPRGFQPLVSDYTQSTPLLRAVIKGHQSIAELLLENGADVRAKDSEGRQALHRAAADGNRAITQLLLSHKAEVNATDLTGWTPLHLAIERGHVEMAELLLQSKAEPNILTTDAEVGGSRTGLRWTPLHLAVSKGQTRSVELLLKSKADPNAKDANGYTPLHILTTGPVGRGQIFESLVEHGADLNVKTRNGETPLHLVVSKNNLENASLLLSHKPNLELTNAWGATPLHEAARYSNTKAMAELLVRAGANVNAVNPSTTDTPLLLAIRCWQDISEIPSDATSLIELLVAHKANVNYIHYSGATPLTLAKGLNLQNAQGGLRFARPPALGMPGMSASPIDSAAGLTRAEFAERVIGILKKAGANEALERINRIELTRRTEVLARTFTRPIFTNDWNRHTLLEVIARTYTQGPTPSVYYQATRPVGIPGQAGPPAMPPPNSVLPANVGASFPDFQNVRISRWDLKTGKAREIPVNVDSILSSGDCSQDPWLEWGDAVEIPEADHKRDETWPGLAAAQTAALYQCLKREVTIVVKGEQHRRTLVPFLESSIPSRISFPDRVKAITEGRPLPLPTLPSRVTSSVAVDEPKAKLIEIAAFRLKEVLELSKLLRTSSDNTRVLVKRVELVTKQAREFVLNLEKVDDPGKDLWLRDGDVIEVPEK